MALFYICPNFIPKLGHRQNKHGNGLARKRAWKHSNHNDKFDN